jgi:hypothetical protein
LKSGSVADGFTTLEVKQKKETDMVQKKKKKQSQYANPKSGKVSQDDAQIVVKKILRAYGFDPDLFDSFTKLQRKYLFYQLVEPTRFKAEEGHRVPRRLINFVSESTHRFMRTHYFGDERIGLTYLEFSTYGLSLAYMIEQEKANTSLLPEQVKTLTDVAEIINVTRVVEDCAAIETHIRQATLMISKVNFRIYGHNWVIENAPLQQLSVRSTVLMSSEDPISIRFKHNQKERVAFRVRAGRVISEPAYNATIDRWFIFHGDEETPVYLDIYIQSHALQRIKERLDIFPAHRRNFYVMEPLLYMHEVEESMSGNPMLTCYFKDGLRYIYLGYFPFIIQKNKLIVLSFLPLISEDTLAGWHLSHRLGLQIKDRMFLGMDKLSFFLTVDFDQIPVLKKALSVTSIWSLVEYAASHPELGFTIDQKKTQMVKKFFEHKEEVKNEMPDENV